MPFKKILWATDLSECARHALDQALVLARRDGAQLRAVFVAPVVVALPAGAPGDLAVPIQEWLGSIEEGARTRLYDLTQDALTHGDLISWEVRRHDSPAEGVLEAAAEWGADLIVIGRQGHSALEDLLLGSTAVKLVNHARLPVLVVPHREHDRSTSSLLKVLVTMDVRDLLPGATEIAAEIASRPGGSLTLLYVLEHPWGAPPEDVMDVLTEQVDKVMESEVQRIGVEQTVAEVTRRLVTASSAWQGILEQADTCDVDLVVMASHRRGAIGRFFLGSITDKVLQLSRRPVLVVRPEES